MGCGCGEWEGGRAAGYLELAFVFWTIDQAGVPVEAERRGGAFGRSPIAGFSLATARVYDGGVMGEREIICDKRVDATLKIWGCKAIACILVGCARKTCGCPDTSWG